MESDVEKVKARINIADVIGQYVTLKKSGRTYTARCPFHKERTPSFHVSPERGTYKCFGCGEGGDVFSFVQKMDGIDFPTALRQLAEKAGVTLEKGNFKGKSPEEKGKEERLREVCDAAIAYFELELRRRKDVRDYIAARGVHEVTMTHWRLGYAPATWDSLCRHLGQVGFSKDEIFDAGFAIKSDKRPGEIFDRFRGRIIFPIFDVAGAVIGVSGRFYEKVAGQKDDGQEPAKYVNSPETPIFKKSRTLYGLNVARAAIRKADCILLVEGQFDLIMAHQSGLPFAVALSGTALTPEHLTILSRLSKRLVLALDADDAGIRAGLKSALMALVAGFDVKVPVLPHGKDPADVAKENAELLKAAVRTSKTAVEFFLDVLRPQARDEHAYKKLVEAQVVPLVGAFESSIDRDHFAAVVARKLGVSPEAVLTEARKRAPKAEAAPSPEVHEKSGELELSAVDKKAAMVLFGLGAESPEAQKLSELLGREHIQKLRADLEPRAEDLRFMFDAQVHSETTEAAVAADMLGDIARVVERERVKMKFV
ncbi:MAG: DNA primase [Patescibacteria group bacterium]